MDALIDAEMKLLRLDAAMRMAVDACVDGVPPAGPPVPLAEAVAFDAARMRLDAYKAAEVRRLAPVAAAVNACFGEAQQALQRLSDAPPAHVAAEIASLERQQAALDQELVALYAEAAVVDDEIHRRIEAAAVNAFGGPP